MRDSIFDAFKFSWLPVVVCICMASLLAGCGDSAIGTSSSESGSGMIVSGVGVGGTGVVKSAAPPAPGVDTGLIGAVVFVDENGNRLPDPDEPFAITDQNGRYTGIAADQTPLLVQVIGGASIIRATGQVSSSTYTIELGQAITAQ